MGAGFCSRPKQQFFSEFGGPAISYQIWVCPKEVRGGGDDWCMGGPVFGVGAKSRKANGLLPFSFWGGGGGGPSHGT